jgi:ABC-2 type transport system ATP-binding protein
MSIITVRDLSKEFKIYRREPGLSGAFRGLFKKKYELKMAVNCVSFKIEKGQGFA